MADLETPNDSLASVNSSLDALEEALAPLEARPWSETVGELSTLDRTKMDVLGAYLINDLIWVYLKTKGVDPAKHQVTEELERIKTYYAKVASLERPEEVRPKVNSATAHRFVSASIPRAQHLPPTTSSALAAAQASRALKEAEEDSLRRLGKASRFRHIEEEGTIRMVPGQGNGEDEDAVEDVGDEDVMMAEDNGQQAEEFLRQFASEIQEKTK